MPRVLTTADPVDLSALLEDIRKARSRVDVVVLTIHWGLHFTPKAVASYESEIARAAIDAGANIVLGHHQHILKGIEIYKGSAIFHGLGNFAMDVDIRPHLKSPKIQEMAMQYPEYAPKYYEDYPTYPFHPEARQTIIASVRIEHGSVSGVSFLPCSINHAGQPETLSPSEPRFDEVVSYMRDACTSVGFSTELRPKGDEVEVVIA
jgi:poly-gamma-glutamate synthesis protein (capsule biosynthesis protein)